MATRAIYARSEFYACPAPRARVFSPFQQIAQVVELVDTQVSEF
jgi:hypothetical protein